MIKVGIALLLSTASLFGTGREEVAECFLVPIYCDPDFAEQEGQPRNSLEHVLQLIETEQIGGVLLKGFWTLDQGIEVISALQAASAKPLIISLDVETGLGMRFDDVERLPPMTALGHIQDRQLILEVGKEIGRQCHSLGVNLAFAPVVDINSNPHNPVIGMRSLGMDPDQVAEYGALLIQGIQSEGVGACAKHFPGHGDTAIDSHKALPVISRSLKELEEVELVPFKAAIEGGISSLMTGHLLVSAIDSEPASLSKKVTAFIRQKLDFEGVLVTDDLLMRAIDPTEAPIKAFEAGADLILSALGTTLAIDQISETEPNMLERLDRVRKFKRTYPSHAPQEPELSHLHSFIEKLYREAIYWEGEKPLLGESYSIQGRELAPELAEALPESPNGRALVFIEKVDNEFLKNLPKETIVVLFGSPYGLTEPLPCSILVAYNSSRGAQKAVYDALKRLM